MTTTMTNGREAAVLAGVPNQLLVGGDWRASSSGTTLPVEDPATGQTLVRVADASPQDGEAALSAAAAAQAGWAATAPRERGRSCTRPSSSAGSPRKRCASVAGSPPHPTAAAGS